MLLKGVIFEDFINYKKPSMVLQFPRCTFKCDKECGKPVCQNSTLAKEPDIEVNILSLLKRYIENPITKAIVFQGLEPFDSYADVACVIGSLRNYYNVDDDIVIYTGYKKEEIQTQIDALQRFKNIIVKYGRFIPDQEQHYDEVLGVNLASPNQYAEYIGEKTCRTL